MVFTPHFLEVVVEVECLCFGQAMCMIPADCVCITLIFFMAVHYFEVLKPLQYYDE